MSDALQVLLVSSDRWLLRQGALMLEEFGVRTIACADAERARRVLAAQSIDILLLDETALQGDPRTIGAWKEASGGEHVHLLVLCSEATGLNIHEAFEAGAGDFLRKPFSAGELLARLRAAARYGEFERRFREQSWEDPVTGLWGRQALVDRLDSELSGSQAGRELSLLVLEIDFFDHWERYHGERASLAVIRSVAALFDRVSVASQVVARLGGGQFAVLLPDEPIAQAARLAEALRSAVAGLADTGFQPEEPLTASVGVTACHGAGDTANQALSRALHALHDAKRSGRDYVVCWGQYDDERRRWAQQMSSGNPFASCVARDVMTPFSLALSNADTLTHAQNVFQQTRLEVLPVSDAQGRLAGIVDREAVAAAVATATHAAQPLEPLVLHDLPRLSEGSSLEAVIDQFVAEDQPLLIVVSADERALGCIARDRFLNLVKPIETQALSGSEYSSRTDYLVVPDFAESV